MEKSNPTYEELLKKVEEQEKEIQSLKANQNGGRKNLFQTLFTDSYSIKLIIDFETGQIIKANKSACKFYGYLYDELTSMNINEINTLSPEEVKKEMQNAKSEVKNYFNFKHRLKNGQIKDVEVHSGKLLIENKICLYSIIYDVTENKQKETELEKSKLKLIESEQLYRDTFNHAAIGIAHVTPNGRFLKVNQKFCNIVGYTQNQLEKLNFADITHPDDLELDNEQIEKVIANKMNSFTITKRYIHKNGKILWINLYSNVIREKNNQIKFAIASILDVTEQKVLQAELITAKEKAEESDRLKSAFLANMSHEIRTPMNAIIGFSNLLKKKNLTKDKEERYLDLIDSGGKRLLNLISDIVDVSKIDANQISLNNEACNINKLIDNLQRQFEISTSNIGCDIKTQKGLKDANSIISIDETRLMQILSNLLENALKFTKKGNVEFGYTMENEVLQFFVKDDGIGIDPKNHKTIFERFNQVANNHSKSGSGTGLGLTIVKSLVNLLKGEVWVESEKEKGATFYFTIPYQPAKFKGDNSINENIHLKKYEDVTILIAEDEHSNYIYLEALLEEYKYNLIHVVNGKEAIDALEKNKEIDLVLMDIKMPIMNGYEATLEIRKTNKNIPIIALTAYAMETDKQKAIKSGCNDYLAKPLPEDKLKEIVKKYIEQE